MLRQIFIVIFIVILACPAHIFAWGANPLSLTYAGGTGSGKSSSDFVENQWQYKYQYHVLALSGDIPQGSLFSQIQFEERDGETGLAYARVALSGSTYALELGDSVANFSDLTLNSLAYQGASVTLKPSSAFNLTVIGGSRGNGLWGSKVRRDTRLKETFTGIKTVYYPGYGIGLNATYLSTNGGSQVTSYGGEYAYKDYKVGLEYGLAPNGKAFRGDIKYQSNWLQLGTIFRDVESTYVVPFDYIGYKGMKGTYSSLGIRPSNALSLNLQSDSYIDRLNGDPYIMNVDTRGDISYNITSTTNIGYSGWKYDRPGYDRGGATEGEMMYITQQFYLITRNAIYYRYIPTWFESKSVSEESYDEQKNVTGINISLFDIAHLNYEIENSTKLLRNADTTISPRAITTRIDMFESRIQGTDLYVSSTLNYREDLEDRSATEEATTTTFYEDITLKYMPDPDFSCYITTKLMKIKGPEEYRVSREQNDISFGLNYTFNTLFIMK